MGTRPIVIPDEEVQYVRDEDVNYTPLKKRVTASPEPTTTGGTGFEDYRVEKPFGSEDRMTLLKAVLAGATGAPLAALGPEVAAARSLAPLYPVMRATVGGLGGAWAGGHGGRFLGNVVGEPEAGEKVGATVGGLAGALGMGGGFGWRGRLRELIREGGGTPEGETAPIQAAQQSRALSTPNTAQSLEPPLVVPEPRGPRALVESISREELPDLASRGVEGAGEQLSRIGRPVIYAPSGVPIESLGRSTPFEGAMSSAGRARRLKALIQEGP